jgi:RNA polymerase primary sigma factor
MAKKYSRSGYPLHELINEGNLGLIEAANRFDPDRGVRFITYASWWVRQAILAAIAHYGQVFRVPPKLKHELYRFQTRVANLTQDLSQAECQEIPGTGYVRGKFARCRKVFLRKFLKSMEATERWTAGCD